MHDHPLKRVPAGAVQHQAAGPYSPVIEINARRLVVLSGQIAVRAGFLDCPTNAR